MNINESMRSVDDALADFPGLRRDLDGVIGARRDVLSNILYLMGRVADECRGRSLQPIREALPDSRLARDPFSRMRKNDMEW